MLTRRRFVERMLQATAGAAVVATVPDTVLEALDLLAPKRLYVPGAQTITTVTLTHWREVRFPMFPDASMVRHMDALQEQLCRAVAADFTQYSIPAEVRALDAPHRNPITAVVHALQHDVAAHAFTPLAATVTHEVSRNGMVMGFAQVVGTNTAIPKAQRPALIAAMQHADAKQRRSGAVIRVHNAERITPPRSPDE